MKKKTGSKTEVNKKKAVSKSNQEKWFLINASGKILGKVAVVAAKTLLAKSDPTLLSFETPNWRVVIINASKVAVTGRKEQDKKYYRYSGYPGGLKVTNLAKLREKDARQIITHAVFGMLPKNRLGSVLQGHLYVYSGADHPHEAQKPETLEVK